MKRRYIGFLVVLLFSLLCRGITGIALASEEHEIEYTVSFVDTSDYNTKIFNMQRGKVAEGTVINVSFPKQIIGTDGHIWKSVVDSPQAFTVYQSGTHKYYIEYEQGEKVTEPDEPDAEEKERLERWLDKAWKADCDITGQAPDGERDPNLIIENDLQNNTRIKNLVSMVQDAEWHYFYMIGKNYLPQTLVIGTNFDAEYSSTKEDTFSVGKEKYTVIRVGVRRNWKPETCVHDWEVISTIKNSCLDNGQETCRCRRCLTEETVLLPALGHHDTDSDSLCDLCGRRVFEQTVGDKIQTTLKTKEGDIPLAFRCLDTDYNGTGKMLYLSEDVLGKDITGICFDEADYNDSPLRNYFNLAFANDSSIAAALQPIERSDAAGRIDYASLLSKEEYEHYEQEGLIEAGEPYFLRTVDGDKIYAVDSNDNMNRVSPAGNADYGARPFILLNKPVTGETAEPANWKVGDVQMRQVGKKTYRFRCVDEDYSDKQDGHRRAALFLCDSVIRADIDRTNTELKKLTFGTNNNYKISSIRNWLNKNSANSSFNLEPISIGVNTAYTGSTIAGAWEQLDDSRLSHHNIGFQYMQDRLFCLSMEEALKYREELWRFGNSQNNPDSQVSPYSQGYYLRTPFYEEDERGAFQYGSDIYVVDLLNGNIHTALTTSETYGIRPAFALPQG